MEKVRAWSFIWRWPKTTVSDVQLVYTLITNMHLLYMVFKCWFWVVVWVARIMFVRYLVLECHLYYLVMWMSILSYCLSFQLGKLLESFLWWKKRRVATFEPCWQLDTLFPQQSGSGEFLPAFLETGKASLITSRHFEFFFFFFSCGIETV